MNAFIHGALAVVACLSLVARGNSIQSSDNLSPDCFQIRSACRNAGFIAGGKAAYTKQWDIVDTESNTGIIRDWPQIPKNFLIPDYSELAQSYEKITFINNDPRTHRWVKASTRANYRGESILQPAFLLDNRFASNATFSESLVVFPGILSSALRGVDMTDLPVEMQSGDDIALQRKNIVRMIKAYYHSDPIKNSEGLENGLFTDHFQDSVGGGNSFWYQLGPNVYAMQIQSMYEMEKIERGSLPTEPSLDVLTHRMTDTLFRMSEFLKGQKTTSFPSFDFAGVSAYGGRIQSMGSQL